jgi:hypothetical protein
VCFSCVQVPPSCSATNPNLTLTSCPQSLCVQLSLPVPGCNRRHNACTKRPLFYGAHHHPVRRCSDISWSNTCIAHYPEQSLVTPSTQISPRLTGSHPSRAYQTLGLYGHAGGQEAGLNSVAAVLTQLASVACYQTGLHGGRDVILHAVYVASGSSSIGLPGLG